MSNENRPNIDPNAMNPTRAQPNPSVGESANNDNIAFILAECANDCAMKCGHAARIDVSPGRSANKVGGPIGDMLLIPAEKLVTELVATHGVQVVSMLFAALRARLPI